MILRKLLKLDTWDVFLSYLEFSIISIILRRLRYTLLCLPLLTKVIITFICLIDRTFSTHGHITVYMMCQFYTEGIIDLIYVPDTKGFVAYSPIIIIIVLLML